MIPHFLTEHRRLILDPGPYRDVLVGQNNTVINHMRNATPYRPGEPRRHGVPSSMRPYRVPIARPLVMRGKPARAVGSHVVIQNLIQWVTVLLLISDRSAYHLLFGSRIGEETSSTNPVSEFSFV